MLLLILISTAFSRREYAGFIKTEDEIIQDETGSDVPRYAIFIKQYSTTKDIENKLISRLNRTDLLYDFLLEKSEELYEQNCEGKDHKECKESFPYRSAAYVLSHTIQVSLFTRYDLGNFLFIDDKVTHLIIVLPSKSYMADQISFSRLPVKMNVTIVGIQFTQHSLDMFGGDRRDEVDQLFLESIDVDIYALGKLQVGSVIMDTSSYSPLSNTYTIKEDVKLYMNANTLSTLRYTQSNDVTIFTNTNNVYNISFNPNLNIYSGSSLYTKRLPAKDILTVYTSSNSVELNFESFQSPFLEQIIISYQKPQYIKMRDVISCFLEFNETESSSNETSLNMKMKRKKIKEDVFYLQLTGTELEKMPSKLSIEIQLPDKKALKIIDKDGFPLSMSKYHITRTNVKRTPVNIDYLDFENLVPNVTIPKPTPPRSTVPASSNPESFLNGVRSDFYYIVLYGSLLVLFISGAIVVLCIRFRYDEYF